MNQGWEHWRDDFLPLTQVKVKAPEWVLPSLLPPGMTVIAGDPKTFKSRLVLHMLAAVTELKPFNREPKKVPKFRGTGMYFAAEQSPGRIRYIFEKHVLKRDYSPKDKRVNLQVAREPWDWQLDQPENGKDLVAFIKDTKPTVVCLDPWIHFHSLDENDPLVVRPLVPVRKAVLSYGGSLVLVHHANKGKGDGGKSGAADWHRVRGTSALWGMADAGIFCSRTGKAVSLACEFKDHEPYNMIWRP